MLTTIEVDFAAGTATITLNRLHRKNAMSFGMVREVYETLSAIAARPDIHVVILTGAGGWFCPGGDIEAVLNGETEEDIAAGYSAATFRVPALLHEMPQLTIAAINGPCAAAGLGWALACDLRFASTTAKFSTAFLDRGFAGDMSVPWTLPRIVGSGMARALSFLPAKLDPTRALAIGLVNDVFAQGEFADRLDAIVRRLLGFEPKALRTLKAHYVAAERMQLVDYCDHETRALPTNVRENAAGFASFLSAERDQAGPG